MSAQRHPAQAHDRTRRAQLAERIARNEPARLQAVASRRGVPRGDLDDVVQSALVDFLRSFSGPYDQAHALSYLFRCVQNRALNYDRWRRRRRAPLVDLHGDDGDEPDRVDALAASRSDVLDRVLEREEHAAALARLGELPKELREVVSLRGLGYSTDEIAALTGRSHRGVRKRIERANRALAREG